MRCGRALCSGEVQEKNPFFLIVGCGGVHSSAYPCSDCGRLHWKGGDLVYNRSREAAFLRNNNIFYWGGGEFVSGDSGEAVFVKDGEIQGKYQIVEAEKGSTSVSPELQEIKGTFLEEILDAIRKELSVEVKRGVAKNEVVIGKMNRYENALNYLRYHLSEKMRQGILAKEEPSFLDVLKLSDRIVMADILMWQNIMERHSKKALGIRQQKGINVVVALEEQGNERDYPRGPNVH